MKWVPLHLHSHYSLLDGLSKPDDIAERCEELGYESCALTDHGSISGAVQFSKSLRGKKVKPILGSELYVSAKDATIQDSTNSRKHASHLVVLAKNKDGWENLVTLTSIANKKENYYHTPRVDKKILSEYAGNILAFSGHPGSELANVLFKDKSAYSAKTVEQAQKNVVSDPIGTAKTVLYEHLDIFGKENFSIEIQLVDEELSPTARVIADILRELSHQTGIPCLATADSHYPRKTDMEDHRILICSALGITLEHARHNDVPMKGFFNSDNYHIPSEEEMLEHHKGYEHELERSLEIAESCKDYSVLSKPRLPQFDCPQGVTEQEYLTQLCRQGWRDKLMPSGHIGKYGTVEEYGDRVKKELSVIENAGLAGYFLVVQDYVNWAKSQGYLIGPGRGSGAGSIVCFLTGITGIDPIRYDLIFERFYNEGRNTEDRVSLPDIDVDFPIKSRDIVIDYIRDKYGRDKTGQMVTFGKMQGRGALKEVLRVHGACSHYQQNKITKCLPGKAEIDDKLKEAGEESIIKWTLQNEPELTQAWCHMNEEGEYGGEYGRYFEQAARLEGTFKTQGKHAAGVVISTEPLYKLVPLVRPKSGESRVLGMEMNDLEDMGHVKFDVLGLAALDKLMAFRNLLKTGTINEG